MLPCGTPEITGRAVHVLELIEIATLASVWYASSHFEALPAIPMCHNLDRISLWATESKPFLKCKYMISDSRDFLEDQKLS